VFPNYNVIQDFDAYQGPSFYQPPGYFDILTAGLGVSTGMVVYKYYGSGTFFDGGLKYLPWVNNSTM
jgi:hypothetical protein